MGLGEGFESEPRVTNALPCNIVGTVDFVSNARRWGGFDAFFEKSASDYLENAAGKVDFLRENGRR